MADPDSKLSQSEIKSIAAQIANAPIAYPDAAPTAVDSIDIEALLRRARYPMTDLGNAERFVDRFCDKLMFVKDIGWFTWCGTHWSREGADARVSIAEHETARGIQDEADALIESSQDWETEESRRGEKVKASDLLKRFGRSSEARSKLEAISSRAAPLMSKSLSDLDCNPFLFNLLNGTLEIHRREDADFVQLLPHNPRDFITKVAPVSYDPNATCPVFDVFMNRVQPDAATQRFLAQWAGLSLTGYTGEQKFAFFYGRGRNGKSVFVNILKFIAGNYADTIPIESFLDSGRTRNGGQATPDLACLPGVRCLTTSEPEKGARFAENLVKLFTGEDEMKARHLNRDFFSFKPQAKLTMQGNYRPKIFGTDEGIWNRVLLVPWSIFIPAEERDPNLGEKLRSEASGILNRFLDGLRYWIENGLAIPTNVSKATAEYRSDSDPLGRFLTDCTRIKGGSRVQSTEMHRLFCAWAKANGETIWSAKGLSAALQERGMSRIKSDTIHWLDIELTRSVMDFDVLSASQVGDADDESNDDTSASRSSRNWEDER